MREKRGRKGEGNREGEKEEKGKKRKKNEEEKRDNGRKGKLKTLNYKNYFKKSVKLSRGPPFPAHF